MKKLLCATALCSFIAGTAGAQDAAFATKMREVNLAAPLPDRRAIDSDALATVQAIAQQGGKCVPAGIRMDPPTPVTADRMAIQSIQAGKLKNMWIAYGVAMGCAGATSTRFVIFQLPDGGVHARVVNIGESLTSPTLMRDTSTGAALAAYGRIRAADPTCDGKGIEMTGSRVSTRSSDLAPDFYGARYRGSWEEIWAFKVCGQVAAVPISFRADGAGGANWSVNQQGVMLYGR